MQSVTSKFLTFFIYKALCVCIIACAAASAFAESDALMQRSNNPMAGLHGVNVILNRGFSIKDFPILRSWGVNLIRLNIMADPQRKEYDNVYGKDGRVSEAFLQKLDAILDGAAKEGIQVVLDMHTFPGYSGGKIWTNRDNWSQLNALWKIIVERTRQSQSVIGYDLINEPNLALSMGAERHLEVRAIQLGHWSFPERWRGTSRDYFALVTELASMINESAPNKLVIVEGVGLGGRADNFKWMVPISAKRVVYSYHTYVPRAFGNLGKGSVDQKINYQSARDRHYLEEDAAIVNHFSKKYNVPIFVGEFGATYYSEGRGGGEWIHDAISIFNKYGWSWTYWNYSIPLRAPQYSLVGGKPKQVEATERLSALKSAMAQK